MPRYAYRSLHHVNQMIVEMFPAQEYANYACLEYENYACLEYANYACLEYANYACLEYANYACLEYANCACWSAARLAQDTCSFVSATTYVMSERHSEESSYNGRLRIYEALYSEHKRKIPAS